MTCPGCEPYFESLRFLSGLIPEHHCTPDPDTRQAWRELADAISIAARTQTSTTDPRPYAGTAAATATGTHHSRSTP